MVAKGQETGRNGELQNFSLERWNFSLSTSKIPWQKIFTGWNTDSFKEQTVPAAAAAKSLQLCLTLCDPRDGSPPGSPVPGILQARTPEWAAISFSNAWKWKVKVKLLRRDRLLVTPWTAAYQAPPSTGPSRQEHWSGVPLPSLRQSLFIVKTVSKNTRKRPHFMKLLHPWHQKGSIWYQFCTCIFFIIFATLFLFVFFFSLSLSFSFF